MKPSLSQLLLGAALGVFLQISPFAAAADGTVFGQVSNAATGVNLEGATIQVEGASNTVMTEGDGTYRLSLAPGQYSVTASYSGLDPQRSTVVVRANQPARLDFALTAEIYRLSAFVVATEREGNALAHTMQRNAPNVKNVVSADAFGALSGNPAELLERLTGVVVDRVGGDARFISIRGIGGALNSVQIDGTRRAAAESRGLQFESIGSDHIESMELIKAPTPDMDADAIGGTVNLKSRSAFDVTGRRFTYSVGGLIGKRRYDVPLPAGTIHYSNIFNAFGGEKNLGVSFSANFRQHIAAMDITTMNYQNTTAVPAFLNSIAYDGRASLRSRWGAGLKLDYKLNDEKSVFANFTFSPHSERASVPVTTVSSAATIATLNAQGQPTGTGTILPNFTEDRTEARAMTTTLVSLSTLRRVRNVDAYSAQLGGRSKNERYDLDYDVSYSLSEVKDAPWVAAASLRNVGWIFDRTQGSRWAPTITYTAGLDPANLNNYSENLLTNTKVPILGRIYGTQVNYLRKFDVTVPAHIKAGARLRREESQRQNLSRRWRYAGNDNVLNNGDENLGQFLDENLTYAPMHGVYRGGPFLSSDKMREHLEANGARWQEDVAFGSMNPLVGNLSATEDILAGYVQGSVRIDRLTLLAGVRVEKTKLEAEGPLNQITAEERARRAAFTGALTNEEIIRRNQAQYGNRRAVESDYRNVFPGVHLKFEALRGLIFRGSYSTSIGRPAFTSIIPNDNFDEVTRIVMVNNTGLKPQYSQNFDLSAEYYFEPVGLLSAGVFRKNLTDFIYSTAGQAIPAGADNGFDGNFVGFELRSQANGGSARIQGFEANYQQQLTFLPGWWSGFGIFANFTKLETEGNYGTPGAAQTTDTLPNFTPSAANAGISYIRGKWNLRVAYGFAGEILLAYNAAPNLRRYRAASHRIDLKLNYRLNKSFDVYVDVYNLANDKQREVWGVNDRPRMILDRNDPQIHFGFNGRL